MTIPEIINSIHLLAEEHRSAGNETDDLKDTEWLESKGFQLIIDHCVESGLLVNGFPANLEDGFVGDEEVTEEYWQLYIDYLTIVDTDVALLHFEWANAFWPGEFKSREDLVESVQARLTGGFYDVTL